MENMELYVLKSGLITVDNLCIDMLLNIWDSLKPC